MQLAKPKWRQLSLMMALLAAPTVKQAADFIRENDYTIQCKRGHLACAWKSHDWWDLSGFSQISVTCEGGICSPFTPPLPLRC